VSPNRIAEESIIAAIKANDIDLFFSLIHGLENTDIISFPGLGVIKDAALAAPIEIIEHLVCLSTTNQTDKLASLYLAADAVVEIQNLEVFKFLVTEILKIHNSTNSLTYMALDYLFTCAITNIDMVKYLLSIKELVEIVKEQPILEGHPLYVAASRGNVEVFNLLLKFPWKLSIYRLHRALNHALDSKQKNIVKILVKLPQIRNNPKVDSDFCLKYAHDIETLNLLLDIPWIADNVALEHNAAYSRATHGGHLDKVERLVMFEKVLDNTYGRISDKILLCVVKNKHVAVVAKMLEIKYVAWVEILINKYQSLKHALNEKEYKMVHALYTRLSLSKFFYICYPRNLIPNINLNLKRANIESAKYARLYQHAKKTFYGQPNLPIVLWAKIIDFVRPGLDLEQIKKLIDNTTKTDSFYSSIAAINYNDRLLCDDGLRMYKIHKRKTGLTKACDLKLFLICGIILLYLAQNKITADFDLPKEKLSFT
jgi:hypothetical protein